LVEVEGGIWIACGRRHTIGKGYIGGMEKYNSAAIMGFTVQYRASEVKFSGSADRENDWKKSY